MTVREYKIVEKFIDLCIKDESDKELLKGCITTLWDVEVVEGYRSKESLGRLYGIKERDEKGTEDYSIKVDC